MKRTYLAATLIVFVGGLSSLPAQDRFAYAITDIQKEGINWTCLRRVNTSTGEYGELILQGNNITQAIYDAETKQPLQQRISDERMGALPNAAFVTGVAAIAYDRRHQRIFFTPMFFDQIRYLDLKDNRVYLVQQALPDALKIKAADQGNIITRMAIASDGYGYAISNDGRQLIRFSTGKNINVSSLGGLADDPANKDVSIHNACTSYGGDIIADNSGFLYLFTARNHIFRIDPQTKLALHLGTVKGLPEGFSINGAVVTDNNQVLVSSAMTSQHLYQIDPANWSASAAEGDAWRSSDMANSNLLATRPANTAFNLAFAENEPETDLVKIFPNPVQGRRIQLTMNLPAGNYSVQVVDISGRAAALSVVNVQQKNQTHAIQLSESVLPGTYLVKLLNNRNEGVFSEKVLLK